MPQLEDALQRNDVDVLVRLLRPARRALSRASIANLRLERLERKCADLAQRAHPDSNQLRLL